MDWNWNYQWGAPKSWICSSCGRSFAPHVSECPYCNNQGVVYRSGTSTNDSEWWEEYLKQSQTGKPVNDNPSITTATATSSPNSGNNGTVYTSDSTDPNDSKWWKKLRETQSPTDNAVTEMGQNLVELLHNAIGGLFND